ncbi:MAG TPA: hypothetical protein VGK34_07020, partial [Armatimonadota bacterium]
MQENSRESVISPEEIAEAKANANHFDPRVRGKWIEFLAKNGPCAWNDLKKWAMDSEADIRWRVFYSMGNALDAAGYLCEADKGKCLSILTAAAEKYS